MEVCRPGGRLGWQLEFGRTGDGEPTVCYYPRHLLQGGKLVVSGARRYRLRCPLVRDDWRVTGIRASELVRIAFRGGPSPDDLRTHVAFGRQATDEPLLLVVILAASVAILVHNEEVRAPVYAG